MRVPIIMFWLVFIAGPAGCRTENSPAGAEPHTNERVYSEPEEARHSDYQLRFSEIGQQSGISVSYENGAEAGRYSMLEFVGGGVGVIDFDADGWADLFFPGGGTFENDQIMGMPGTLLRNCQGVKFLQVSHNAADGFTSQFYSHGISAGDFNSDGFPDFVITGYGGVGIWINHGDGTFSEVADQLGIVDEAWSTGGGWGDFNQDGHLDLYLVHYLDWNFSNDIVCYSEVSRKRDLCPPRAYGALGDSAFLSNGDGTYRRGEEELGLRTDGKGLGILIADFNVDGQVDIYIANDSSDNFLYLQHDRLPLSECGMINGVAVDRSGMPNGSMGVALLDFDANGLPDIWITNFENESFALYRNDGAGTFLEASGSSGIQLLGRKNVGFGTASEDLDLDGDEDIFITNGHTYLNVVNAPIKQLPIALINQDGSFRRAAFPSDTYMTQAWLGRGLAPFDFDHDGDSDLIISDLKEPAALLRNDTFPKGNWVRVQLVGRASNRDAIGATAILEVSNKELVRQRIGGGSYLSSGQPELCWGIGEAEEVGPLVIRWPSGNVTTFDSVIVNDLTLIVEPEM